jgi:hypothetical protein
MLPTNIRHGTQGWSGYPVRSVLMRERPTPFLLT